MDLTIACLKWGRWGGAHGAEYVNRLHRGVRRHLRRPFRFVCFTDDATGIEAGVEIRPMAVPGWRWNLRKMLLYKPGNGLTGRVLALDLDTVVTGPLDEIAAYGGAFCVLEDFYEPGQAGGGVVSFRAGEWAERLWQPLIDDPWAVHRATRGSERMWYRRALDRPDFWQHLLPGQIVSYKPRPGARLEALPEGARMVCFHGRPRPHEADGWVRAHWR